MRVEVGGVQGDKTESGRLKLNDLVLVNWAAAGSGASSAAAASPTAMGGNPANLANVLRACGRV